MTLGVVFSALVLSVQALSFEVIDKTDTHDAAHDPARRHHGFHPTHRRQSNSGQKVIGDGRLLVIAKNDFKVCLATSKTLEGARPIEQGNLAGGVVVWIFTLCTLLAGDAALMAIIFALISTPG